MFVPAGQAGTFAKQFAELIGSDARLFREQANPRGSASVERVKCDFGCLLVTTLHVDAALIVERSVIGHHNQTAPDCLREDRRILVVLGKVERVNASNRDEVRS